MRSANSRQRFPLVPMTSTVTFPSLPIVISNSGRSITHLQASETYANAHGLIPQDFLVNDSVVSLLQLRNQLVIGELLHDASGDLLANCAQLIIRVRRATYADRACPTLVLAKFDCDVTLLDYDLLSATHLVCDDF